MNLVELIAEQALALPPEERKKLGAKLLVSVGETFFEEQMRTNDFTYLPIAPAHVFGAAALPLHHHLAA